MTFVSGLATLQACAVPPWCRLKDEPFHVGFAALLAQIEQLYENGRYLDAWEASQGLGPLQHWPGPEGRLLAGRLAFNLGGIRLSAALHWLAKRQHPQHASTLYYWAVSYRERFGSLHAWRRYGTCDLPAGACKSLAADWLAFKAGLLGSLRDFSRAEPLMIEALELDPDNAWLHVKLADLLEAQDLIEDALMAAREAMQLRPAFRPAVQSVASLLMQLCKDAEALEILSGATREMQSGELWCQLAALQREMKNYEDAWQSLDEAERCMPLAVNEKSHHQWFTGQRCDLACLLNRYEQAHDLARQVDHPYYQQVAEHLGRAVTEPVSSVPRRVQLSVPFVRQHHETCAPAVASSIASYWQKPASQQEIADRIAYHGTLASDLRCWALESGFFVREFRITPETTGHLLQAGVPLIVATSEPGVTHSQCIVGSDTSRGTWLLQDPAVRHVKEVNVDTYLTQQASTGPCGMLILPPDQQHRIHGIQLEDAALYDQRYAFDVALERNDAEAIQRAYDDLHNQAPDHRLTLHCGCLLAEFKGDPDLQIGFLTKLLEQFPGDVNLLMMKRHWLKQFGTRVERLALLRDAYQSHAQQPMVCAELGKELLADDRDHEEAYRLLRRSLRYSPTDATALTALASYYESHRDYLQALDLRRLAAAAQDKEEALSQDYFLAAQKCDRTEQALAWLSDRYRRLHDRDIAPACTLVNALESCHRLDEAQQVLQSSLKQHPANGELLAFAASYYAAHGQLERATEYLTACEPKCQPWRVLRTRAMLASYAGNHRSARDLYCDVVKSNPLDYDALDQLVELELELSGLEPAWQHLQAANQRFPNNLWLRIKLIRFLRDHKRDSLEPELTNFIALHPEHAGARREMALLALDKQDIQRAWQEALAAILLEPNDDFGHYVVGRIEEQRGEMASARAAYRRALELNIDRPWLMSCLLNTCQSDSEREAELAFLFQQLKVNVSQGSGIAEYRAVARTDLNASTLLAQLEEIRSLRPHVWQAWSVVIHQRLAAKQTTAAIELARQATERFPHELRAWFDLCRAYQEDNDMRAELATLVRARAVLPLEHSLAVALAERYLKLEEYDQAEHVLKDALEVPSTSKAMIAELALRLFESQLQANKLIDAQRVLDFSGKHLPPGYHCAARMQLLAAQDLQQEPITHQASAFALKWLEEDNVPRVPLTDALDSLDERLGHQLLTVLKGSQAASASKHLLVKPTVGWALGRLAGRLQGRSANIELLKSIPDGDSWHACARSLLEGLPLFGKDYEQLDVIVQRYRGRLKNQTATWSTISWALAHYDRTEEIITWTRDWRSYPDLRVADLVPAIAARWHVLQIREARKAIGYGLTLPEDHAASQLKLWAGLDAFLQRQTRQARNYAQGITPTMLRGWETLGYRLLREAISALPSDGAKDVRLSRASMRESLERMRPEKLLAESPYANVILSKWLSHQLAARVAQAHGRPLTAWRHRFAAFALTFK